ncbi:MAG: hypothetical protein V4609_01935 [Pseudomonadota bacterium]
MNVNDSPRGVVPTHTPDPVTTAGNIGGTTGPTASGVLGAAAGQALPPASEARATSGMFGPPILEGSIGSVDMLELSAALESFQKGLLTASKEMIQKQITDLRGKLTQKLEEQQKMWDRMDAQARAAKRNRITGWISKSFAVAGLAIAMGVLVASGAGGPGAIALGAVMVMMLAGSASSMVGTGVQGQEWSFESALTGELGAAGGMGVGGLLSGNLGNMAAGIAMASGTDDAKKLAIVGAVFTALQAVLMMGGGMTVSAGKAAGATARAAQTAGQLAGSATQIAQGVQGIEMAKITKEVEDIRASIKALEGLLKFIENFQEVQRKGAEAMNKLVNQLTGTCGEIVNQNINPSTQALATYG